MPDMTGCLKACETMAGYVPSGSVDMTKHDAKGKSDFSDQRKPRDKSIDLNLTNGSAVIVGVNRGDGGEISVNTNPASEHYVTITGSGVDSNGKYYTFYDPGTSRQAAGTSPSNKLYLGSDYKLSGATAYSGANYTVTEVKTK